MPGFTTDQTNALLYAKEKLSKFITNLATGDGRLQERIAANSIELHQARAHNDLPDEFSTRINEAFLKLLAGGVDFVDNARNMDHKTAENLVHNVFIIYVDLVRLQERELS